MITGDLAAVMRRLALGGFALWVVALALVLAVPTASFASPAASSAPPTAFGELDCNGHSTIQRPVHASAACTDIRGVNTQDDQYTWNGRFYDNGYYIGHDDRT